MAYKLSVKRRKNRPRSVLTHLRREGRVPGIVYGKGMENLAIHMEMSEIIRLLQQGGTSAVVNLDLEGKSHDVMICELQQDRIKDRILHVDFKVINMNEPIDTEVAVELQGEPAGVKEGGILQQQTRTVEIRCLPKKIPDQLTVDISGLNVGDSVNISDLDFPEGVELLSEPEEVIASVLPPQMEQEREAEELDETAAEADKAQQEPELVDAEEKKDEE
ncbi:50S ribosomal protein L25/general stress protein Ctc [Salinithrix halophila]|uniref:Large ribosomal subunit protein bL25 n=1 Tax=Salinithrix halophila TaxID=1485204 RepID=A0ABV8J9I3_9BACL